LTRGGKILNGRVEGEKAEKFPEMVDEETIVPVRSGTEFDQFEEEFYEKEKIDFTGAFNT
jgi:hypothetical protein